MVNSWVMKGIIIVVCLILASYATAPTEEELIARAVEELSQLESGEFVEFPGGMCANISKTNGRSGATMLLQFCPECHTRRWKYEQIAVAGGKPPSEELSKVLFREWMKRTYERFY